MIRPKRLLSACLLWPLFAPASVSALVVEIQGTRLEIQVAGASCVEIAGNYPGVRIEASEIGKSPRICYNSNKVNSITILDAILIASAPVKKDILLKFEHDFPTGINGKVMTRAKLQGFFSTSDGVGVPSGDKLVFSAFFSQNGHDDAVAEPLNLTVGDNLDSAVFDYSSKEQYLISGTRVLKGVLTVAFDKPGHKLTFVEKNGVSLDTGSTMADKLELLEPAPGEEGAAEKTPAPAPEAKKPELPPELSPEPARGHKKDSAASPERKHKKAAPADSAPGQKPELPVEPAVPGTKLDLPTEPPAGATPFTSPPETDALPSH